MTDRTSITQMEKFLSIINGTPEPSGHTSPRHGNVSTTDSAVAAMHDVLQRLREASHDMAERMVTESECDPALREALMTEPLDNGARIGRWEIHAREPSKGRRVYDVVRTGEDEVIASNLYLYEAALGLVRILNAGGCVNSREAMDVLRTEQSFAEAFDDAVRFRRRANSEEGRRKAIFEARYSEAKSRASAAKERIRRASETPRSRPAK